MLALELIILAVALVFSVRLRKNKFVFWGVWLAALVLFFAAINQQSGESLGRRVFEEMGKPAGVEKKIKDYYYGSAKEYVGTPESEPIKPQGKPTWLWWRLCAYGLVCAFIMTIFRVFDDLKAGSKAAFGISRKLWRRQKKIMENGWSGLKEFLIRRQRLKNKGIKEMALLAKTAEKQKKKSNEAKKPGFWELVKADLTASVAKDFLLNNFKNFWRNLLNRGLFKGGVK